MNDFSKGHYGDDAPIAAFATTPGSGALTLIRCSGKGSLEAASLIFVPSGIKNAVSLKDAAGNTIIHGWIVSADEKIDEVLVSVFRSPKSFTGEDSLDICCHGGNSASAAVMNVLKNTGFRGALPGEFTFRAFMNGKLDLTRCESVMELVSARTDTARRHAVSRLSGVLEKEIGEIKKQLVQVLAGAEIFLDYSEDEVSADADEIAGRLPGLDIAHNVLSRLKKLSDSWQLERIYQEGVSIVIAGCPNAGKSSLFNALLKEDRSIVTEVPGTTRDWIEAFVSIEGIPVRLIDTAGLRDADETVEKIGIQKSRKIMEEADIILYLIDGEHGLTEEDKKYLQEYGKPGACNQANGSDFSSCLFVWNKQDINPPPHPFPLADINPISICAKNSEGFTELFKAVNSIISKQAQGFSSHDEPSCASLGTARQKKLVDAACIALEEAIALENKEEPLDVIAPLLRDAVNSLGEITGEVSTADILEEMFSRFCVGK